MNHFTPFPDRTARDRSAIVLHYVLILFPTVAALLAVITLQVAR